MRSRAIASFLFLPLLTLACCLPLSVSSSERAGDAGRSEGPRGGVGRRTFLLLQRPGALCPLHPL